MNELLEFLEEATLMKDFNHKNVLNLVGVVLQNDLPFVLLPLMENADLRTFILNPSNVNLYHFVHEINLRIHLFE